MFLIKNNILNYIVIEDILNYLFKNILIFFEFIYNDFEYILVVYDLVCKFFSI